MGVCFNLVTSDVCVCLQLSRDCKVEVQRILHQRALDVKLDPELQRRCMTDLGKWCSEKTEAGQELECLQDHLDDLVADCKEVVGNLTELESEVSLSPYTAVSLKRATCKTLGANMRQLIFPRFL